MDWTGTRLAFGEGLRARALYKRPTRVSSVEIEEALKAGHWVEPDREMQDDVWAMAVGRARVASDSQTCLVERGMATRWPEMWTWDALAVVDQNPITIKTTGLGQVQGVDAAENWLPRRRARAERERERDTERATEGGKRPTSGWEQAEKRSDGAAGADEERTRRRRT